jgi:hypothetical protein
LTCPAHRFTQKSVAPEKTPNEGAIKLLASIRSRAWLYGTLGLVFLRALPNLRYPLGRDHATFCVIGQGLLHGQLLYRDLWDNKPPGIFYIYAVIVKIFGPVMWSVGVVDILWLLVISCCIFYFCRRYLGTPGAALAVIFYACRHCRQGYLHAAQPEAFLLLCVFAAWFLLRDQDPLPALAPHEPSPEVSGRGWILRVTRCFTAGLMLGAAFWLKYNAVVFCPFVALLPFVDFRELDRGLARLRLLIPWKDCLARMLIVTAGFLFAVAAVIAAFWISGAWPAMREVQFEVLPRYGSTAFHGSTAFLLYALGHTQEHMGIWWEIMPALTLLFAWKRHEMTSVAPILLLALAGYIATAVQGRFLPYYFETCYPFFAMCWAFVCVSTYKSFVQLQGFFVRRHWDLARRLLWVAFAGLAFSLLPEESVRVVEQYQLAGSWWRNPELSYKLYWFQLPVDKFGEQLRVVDYLKIHSSPQDEVYVWGTAPLINFLPQRSNPSRFVSNLGLISKWAPESWRQELVQTLEAKRPRYIVVGRHDSVARLTSTPLDSEGYLRVYPALAGLLNRRYGVAVNYADFEIYELK